MQSILKNKKAIAGIAAVIVLVLAVILLLTMCSPNANSDPTEPTGPSATEPVETGESTEPVEDEPDTETKTLDAMDEVGPWIGSTPAVQTDADGRVWVGSSSRDEQGSVVLSRAFDPAEDMRGYENGYLHVSVYVEDLSKMTGGQLELSSSGNPDARELSWDLMLYLTKSGWNEIDLPFANANRVGGEIDLKNVNFMRVYGIMSEDCKFGIDEIVLTNDEPEEKSHLDEKGQFVIDEVESLGAWIGTAPTLLSDGAPVGSGYVYTNQKDGDALVLMRALDNLDMSAFKNGYLHVWVYVQNVAGLTGGQIELTSSGMADQAETGWDLLAYVKKSGWNELYLPVSQALKVSGGADFSKINYIRVYALTNGSNALGIDYACMSNTAPPAPSRIDANNQFVIDAVESIETWTGSGTYMSYGGAAAGGAWLATNSVDNAGSAVFTRLLTNLDASGYRNGYLHMYLYIQNVDLVTGGQIELSSAGQPDVNETSWNIGGIDLQNGWNDVYLPISEATNVGGGANFGNLNYIRIYVTTTQPQTIGVDYIALSRVAPERDDPVDENGNYIIDNIQGISPWSGSALVYNTEAGHAEGADWLSASSSGTQDMVFFRNFATADLTAYADGYLHVWLYVDDIAHLTGGMIEITSSGTVDDGELYWPLASYVTESGWNELYLPLKDAYAEGATPADMSKMNCIRVVGMLGSSGGNVGIDEIYATNTAPEKEESGFDGVIDPVSAATDWQGTPISYHENGGYIPAADYITSEGTGDLVFFRVFPAVDASAFAEGGLQLWVYVDDVSKLVGGMIEITSAGTVDNEELWWPIANYVTESGWNLVYLPFADAQSQGDAAVDMTQLDCIRVVMSVNAQTVGGIDEVCLTKSEPGTEKIIILNGDNLNATWGNELTFVEGDAPVGTGYIKTGSAVSSVVCANVIPAANIQGYEYTGEVHLWLYVEDASKVIDGQLELTSSGLSDDAETAWNLTPAMLQNGWNELTFKFSDAYLTGSTNYAAVNYMRLYLNFTEASAFGVDEIYVGGIKANVTIPEDDMTMEEAIAAATERSVLNEGSDNMKSAIAAVLGKAANGEKITLVTLGDSITAGAVAPAGLEWASLVKNYLEALDGDAANGNVTLVNAGIGSTEAVLGVSRVEKDVLAHNPDLVIVDFGTNDYGLPYGAEAYEGILCKLISAGVPVINSNVCPASGNNIQDQQLPINQAYGVPMISFKSAYHEFATKTSIAGLRLNDIWSSDTVHPTTAGHKLLADLLTAYLQTYIVNASVASGELDVTLPAKVTNNGFADAVLVENFATNSPVSVTMDGWTADYAARIYQLSTEGWQTSTVGSSITFKVNAGYFYMFFELDSNCGDLEITVDGQPNGLINWAYLGNGYMNSHHIIHLGETTEHTITITLRDNANVENDWAGICAVGAANFEGYTKPGESTDGKIISQIESQESWISMMALELKEGNAAVGSKWLLVGNPSDAPAWATTASGFAPFDLTPYADGYLRVRIYIAPGSEFQDGRVELSSASMPDNSEIAWSLAGKGIQPGWNDVYLPISEGVKTDGSTGPVDMTKINYIHIAMCTPDGQFGLDQIELTEKKSPSDMAVIDMITADSTMLGEYTAVGGYTSGADWSKLTKGMNADAVYYKSFGPMDMSAYANGYLHIWLYVDDVANLRPYSGMIELSSAGVVDKDEIYWTIHGQGLVSGWNELYLPLADATAEGGTIDLTKVDTMRIVGMFGANGGTIGIDEIYLTNEADIQVDPGYEAAVEQANKDAILFAGSDNMKAAIAAVLDKAARGETVKLVVSGSSTPAGAGADAGKGMADLIRNWLDELDGANNGNVVLVNTAIGSTENVFGVSRMDKDILGHNPDLVIIDFGNIGPHMQEAHEGVITKLVKAGVPVVSMNWVRADGSQDKIDYLPVNEAYGVPHLDFKASYHKLANSTDIIGLRIQDIWYFDNVHPSNTGHALLAEMFRYYIQTEILDKDVVPGMLSTELPEKVTNNGFADAILVENFTQTEKVQVTMDGWTGDYAARIYQLSTEGWQTSTVGSSITFKVNAGYFYMFFELDSNCGDLEITVDGQPKGTINWACNGTGYMNPYYIYNFSEAGEHTVTMTLKDNASVENDWFGICAVGASNFDGYAKPVADTTVIVEGETVSPWFSLNSVELVSKEAPVGTNYISTVNSAKNPSIAAGLAGVDISGYLENGYLHFWLYVESASAVTNGQIELNSNGSPNQAEIAWNLTEIGLKDGWNELYLPFADAITTNGDSGAFTGTVKYIRIWTYTSNEMKIAVDKMEAVLIKPETPADPEPAADFVISEVEDEVVAWLNWVSGMGVEVKDGGAAIGNKWIQVGTKTTEPAWATTASGFTSFDLTPYAEGYLRVRLYIAPDSEFQYGRIELSSASMPDNSEIAWDFAGKGIQPGWNDLYLPISEGVKTDGSTGSVDLTKINYVHIAMCTPDGQFGFDKIELTNSAPAEPEPEPVTSVVIDPITADSTWLGTYTTEGGYTADAGWSQITAAANTDAVYYRVLTPIDVSALMDGYLHMWLYIDDVANLRPYAGMIELSSSGAVDNEEIFWEIHSLNLVSGWNELNLPLASALKQGDTAFDPTQADCMRIVGMFGANGGVIGIDELSIVKEKIETPVETPEPEPEPAADLVISEVEDEVVAWLNWVSGMGIEVKDGGAAVGSKWIQVGTKTEAPAWATTASGFTAFDLTPYADGYLRVRIYIAPGSEFQYGRIELSSASMPDNSEIAWDFAGKGIQPGWNDLYLPISEAVKTDGSTGPVDLTKINYIHIAMCTPDGQFGFDQIMLTNTAPVEPEPEPEPVADLVISEVEEKNGWDSVNEITVSTENVPVGNAYVKTTNADYWPSIAWWPAPIDVSDFAESGYLHMWLYVPKAADVVGGEIELTSSGTADSGEIAWPLVNLGLKDGWNELYLPFAEGVRTDGTAPIDFTNINFIRIFAGITTPDCIGIDKMVLTMTKPEETVEDLTVSTVDTLDAWFGADGYGLMPDAAVGDNWVISPKDYWPAVVSSFTPFDVSAYAESGYLHMWLYVPNAALVGGGQIELSSASSPDSAEIGWDLATLGLKNGWNELYLPFAEGIRVDGAGGPVNLAAINYIRIYAGFASPSFFGFDKLEATMSKDGTGATLVISEVEALDLWFGADGYGLMNGSAVGDNWMKSPKDNWPAVVSEFNPTFDVSPYAEEGYLHLWIYIRDASNLVGGQIELSSAGSGDASEIGWNLVDLGLQTGWNEVYLPFAEGIKVDGSTGPVDLSKINYIRIYGGFATADWFGFDQLEATMVKP